MNARAPIVRVILVALVTSAVVALAGAPASAAPIPPGPATSLSPSERSDIRPRPVAASPSPQNPHLAANPRSNIHDDSWMTDTYRIAGPGRRALRTDSTALDQGICGTIAFDRRGRIVTVCPTLGGPQVRVVDPRTLAPLAVLALPYVPPPPGTPLFQNFTGGGYFFLDPSDRVWVTTASGHLLVVRESQHGTTLTQVRDYDLSKAVGGDRITSALPDWSGRVWFVTKQHGIVGTLDPRTRHIATLRLDEEIENSFAVDRHGVFIVSDRSMYRFDARSSGAPRVAWKASYRNSGIIKPGQVDAGSGTTPTVLRGGFVAITDNADPMNVVVYRTATTLRRGRHRRVCAVPVFARGASATENTLIGVHRTLIVENNFGYADPLASSSTAPTTPGFARVDVTPNGTGCRRVWTNTTDAAPSVVPKVSTHTGLVYTYTRPVDPDGAEGWYWTGLDLRTGRRVFRQLAGSGIAYNNNYAGVALGSDGTAYLGTFAGIVALRDAPRR